MAGAYCDSCGAYLVDGHDQDQCRSDRQTEINARGRARAQAELDAARADLAAHTTDSEEASDG